MQTPRPAPYDCVQAEKLLQQQVASLIQKEEACIHGIMKKKRSWWWLILLVLPFYQKISVLTKNTMIRVSQTAREFNADPGMAQSIQEIREQQAAFSRDFDSLAASMRDLQRQVEECTKHNLTVTDNLEKAVSETQEKMVLAGEISNFFEKRLNDVQAAVEIVSTPTYDKRKKRTLPLLTEPEGPRAYHAPTQSSQAKKEDTFVMGPAGVTKLQDL